MAEQSGSSAPRTLPATSPDMAACILAPGVGYYLQSVMLPFNETLVCLFFAENSDCDNTSVFEAVVQETRVSALLEMVGHGILSIQVGQRNPSLVLIRR